MITEHLAVLCRVKQQSINKLSKKHKGIASLACGADREKDEEKYQQWPECTSLDPSSMIKKRYHPTFHIVKKALTN